MVNSISASTANPRGSEWHRWDPHLHAPGTLLSDQFRGDWDAYLRKIESSVPAVHALGVTDYFCIGTYREVRLRQRQGRLANVGFVFPNVEIRLDIKTEKKAPINIHLLFSPSDADHEEQIERVLAQLTFEFRERQYQCTVADLIQLGRAFDSSQTDEFGALRTGANQFKTSLQDLRQVFRKERWVRQNCLVAVASKTNDGTSGLQEDDSYAATRREIETFAHIIFSSTESQRTFWLGKSPRFSPSFIERTYGALKPCLHGSDSHRESRVVAPDADRYCWIKGDLTFETLRQAVIEPEDRVAIDTTPPAEGVPAATIASVSPGGTPWLRNQLIELNAGLVAIIGARGSGKTALVDILAAGAHSPDAGHGPSSFLRRAYSPVNHLGGATVNLEWGDGSTSSAPLQPTEPDEWSEPAPAQVRYLSQHFVERLCSAAGLATDLRDEMERVVFERTDPTERLETESFKELAGTLLEPIRRRRDEIQDGIRSLTDAIVQEDLVKDRLPAHQKDRESLQKQIYSGQKTLAALLPKGKDERVARLTAIESACARSQCTVEGLRRRRRSLDDLSNEISHIQNSVEPARFTEMRRRFAPTELTDTEWVAFKRAFRGDVATVLRNAKHAADLAIKLAMEGDPKSPHNSASPLDKWPLNALIEARFGANQEWATFAWQKWSTWSFCTKG